MKKINDWILKHSKIIETVAVIVRIISFATVSWLGPASPFLWVWIFNTLDAVALSWCALLKKDTAYSLLNLFWILVGVVGVIKAY
jgi:hypothetical protein